MEEKKKQLAKQLQWLAEANYDMEEALSKEVEEDTSAFHRNRRIKR